MRILIFILLAMTYASETVFVACEGNYYQPNGSVWSIANNEVFPYSENPLGEVVQSLFVKDDQLFVAVNVPGSIQVFDITDQGLAPAHFIDTQFSGPREMIVVGNYLYFTNWYTLDVKKLNLSTWEIESEIDMPGLPEDIILHNGLLYVSIIMNNDWTDGAYVVAIDIEEEVIVENYNVGLGPGDLTVHDGEIYIARTYYDEDWNAFYGTARINNNGDVLSVNYGVGLACGGSVHSHGGSIYRAYNGGIALLDNNLQIIPSSRIGEFPASDVYSVEVIEENIYFGLSDFSAPDEIVVLDFSGNEIGRYDVGALPGDFAVWHSCDNSGDANFDNILNVSDVVIVINHILNNSDYICDADINNDGNMDVLDVVVMVNLILNN